MFPLKSLGITEESSILHVQSFSGQRLPKKRIDCIFKTVWGSMRNFKCLGIPPPPPSPNFVFDLHVIIICSQVNEGEKYIHLFTNEISRPETNITPG